jgi:hypothetical protein
MLNKLLVLFGFGREALSLHRLEELPTTMNYHRRMNRCALPDVDSAAGKAQRCKLVMDVERDGPISLLYVQIG